MSLSAFYLCVTDDISSVKGLNDFFLQQISFLVSFLWAGVFFMSLFFSTIAGPSKNSFSLLGLCIFFRHWTLTKLSWNFNKKYSFHSILNFFYGLLNYCFYCCSFSVKKKNLLNLHHLLTITSHLIFSKK